MKTCKRTRNLFSRLLERDLSARARRAVEGHLKVCPTCREEWERFRQTMRLLEEPLPPMSAPLHLLVGVRSALAQPPPRARPGPWALLGVSLAAALALLWMRLIPPETALPPMPSSLTAESRAVDHSAIGQFGPIAQLPNSPADSRSVTSTPPLPSPSAAPPFASPRPRGEREGWKGQSSAEQSTLSPRELAAPVKPTPRPGKEPVKMAQRPPARPPRHKPPYSGEKRRGTKEEGGGANPSPARPVSSPSAEIPPVEPIGASVEVVKAEVMPATGKEAETEADTGSYCIVVARPVPSYYVEVTDPQRGEVRRVWGTISLDGRREPVLEMEYLPLTDRESAQPERREGDENAHWS
ncbi:MAG TPA: hypothetical protein EYP85_11725 [Armatimonadetes bacterium]|nr:hypothetical protein [Armatimonadota bacterium]